jgi:hypothetical protein
MSLSSESSHWLDRNWYWLVILYGIIFVTFLVSFKPNF